jgi:hypothetical protein
MDQHCSNLKIEREQRALDAPLPVLPKSLPSVASPDHKSEFGVLPFAQEWVQRVCRVAAGPLHLQEQALVAPRSLPGSMDDGTAGGNAAGDGGGLFHGRSGLFGGDCDVWRSEMHLQIPHPSRPQLCSTLEPTRVEPDRALAFLAPPVATAPGAAQLESEHPGCYHPAQQDSEPPAAVDASCHAGAKWPTLYFPFLNPPRTPQT